MVKKTMPSLIISGNWEYELTWVLQLYLLKPQFGVADPDTV
jgi:hypothetical protein